VLPAAVLLLALPGGAPAAGGPSYEEATPGPIYAPAPPAAGLRGFRFDGLRLNRSNGRAVLFVRVPRPGRVILHGRGVRRLVRIARRAKRVRLPVRPKVRLLRYLRRHRKARIRVEVTFKPFDGDIPKTIEKVVVLRHRHR
jgi:hypothetical protein